MKAKSAASLHQNASLKRNDNFKPPLHSWRRRQCLHCGKVYLGAAHGRRSDYCSEACRNVAWRRRLKAAAKAAKPTPQNKAKKPIQIRHRYPTVIAVAVTRQPRSKKGPNAKRK